MVNEEVTPHSTVAPGGKQPVSRAGNFPFDELGAGPGKPGIRGLPAHYSVS